MGNNSQRKLKNQGKIDYKHLYFFIEIEGERLGDAAIENILQFIPQDPKCSNFSIHFMSEDFSIDLRTAAARFLGLLLKDAPVSFVLPFSKLTG